MANKKKTDVNKGDMVECRCGLFRREFVASLGACATAVTTGSCLPVGIAPATPQIARTEWYRAYNAEARREVDATQSIVQVLSGADRFLRYVAATRPGILHDLCASITGKLDTNLQEYRSHMRDLDFGQICEPLSFKGTFPELFELSLHLVAKQLRLPQDHSFASPIVEVATVDSLGSQSVPRYHRIKATVEMLGREMGIRLFKGFVEQLYQQPLERRDQRSFKEFKEMLINSWARSESFEFVVVHFDDHMFVGKFNKCMRYEALKELDDPEIGFLAQCYEGPANVARMTGDFRLRRRVTLFDHHFCDEFFWDSNVHGDNPAQPSLRFLESLAEA